MTRESAVLLRPIRPEEHEALGDLTVAAYRSVLGDGLHPEYAQTLRDVGARVDTDRIVVSVDAAGRLLGGVTLVLDPASPNAEFPEPDDAGIRYLAVDPAAQGAGVGARLVEACIAIARDAGKARIVLHTQRAMLGAQHLYSRKGFLRAPAYDWEPRPGVELVGFVLDLRAAT